MRLLRILVLLESSKVAAVLLHTMSFVCCTSVAFQLFCIRYVVALSFRCEIVCRTVVRHGSPCHGLDCSFANRQINLLPSLSLPF